MPMEWSDTALVLAVGRFRETDMWVRLLTRRHGVVRAFAFGGSRSRRRFSGCLDVLNFLSVHAVTSGNGRFLNLEEGVLLEGPRRLRADLPRLGMLMNCVRFLEALGETGNSGELSGMTGGTADVSGDSVTGMTDVSADRDGATNGVADGVTNDVADGVTDGATDAYGLVHAMFTRLESDAPVSDMLPALFRLRLATDQGYVPPFSCCALCGADLTGQGGFFSVAEGVLVCAGCGGAGRQGWVSAQALDVLAETQATLPHSWQPERLASAQRRECLRLVDAFVQYHLGVTWDRGRFRRM